LPNREVDEVKTIGIDVVSQDIIHVAASAEKQLSKTTSLISIIDTVQSGPWEYEENENRIIIRTDNITLWVSRLTGEVTFLDREGNIKLKEKAGGKIFNPITIEKQPYYAIQQSFESPAEEAFYGLGQHQNGQMNYKGDDVELAQHNIVAVVPFLYSSKNYGLLWDNYSITRFGDPREYSHLNSLELYTKDGEKGGLTTDYFNDEELIVSRTENKIAYEFVRYEENLPENFTLQNARVIWEGAISSSIEGKHKFMLYASGYYKLWMNDTLIMDKWRQGWNPWFDRLTLEMSEGVRYHIKLEWIPEGGAYVALKHLDPYDEEEQQRLSFFSEVADQIDYYFINGNDADKVIGGYRELTGKSPIMPVWAMGFWQSRERYRSQEELLSVVREFRDRKIPLDNIVLDWFYWPEDQWGSHEFDASRFHDPPGMVEELHEELNTRIMISVWPKFYPGTEHFDQLQEKGFLYQRNLQKDIVDWVGYPSTFYDAFNPDARDLFWQQINTKLNVYGIDAWWMDATEPDLESNNSYEERKLLMNPTYLGPGARVFNVYSLMNSKGVYEGLRSVNPDRRVFILTRSAFAGQQRYAAATWSGDVAARWIDLKNQIPAGLNFSISGIPFWTSDIGGFSVERRYENPAPEDLEEWRELMTRWYQFGSFCPLFRVHGQYPYREIFHVAPEHHPAYRSMLYYDLLRYRMMPYIYSLNAMTYHEDYTIMRPMIMDFPHDQRVYDLGEQYLFGPALLVCPVYEYRSRSRKIYLPAGNGWYDFYSGHHFPGGAEIDADAPLERIPVFAKEGSIIPVGPDIQFTGEKPPDPIILFVYTGRDATFTLYEDEGTNYGYESGLFTSIDLMYDEEGKELIIGDRNGGYPEMIEKRTFNIVFVSPDGPVPIDARIPAPQKVVYEGHEKTIAHPNKIH
jgi:alpha-D-xyloside xylohydrolase